jgi:hypothetical protein
MALAATAGGSGKELDGEHPGSRGRRKLRGSSSIWVH